MKYLVVGAKGQLGQELTKLLREQQAEFVGLDASELDITNREQVFQIFTAEQPDVILDAAAYTAVDAAEDEGRELNWQVNETGSINLADAAKAIQATLVFISTDYVFGGTKETAYLETDAVGPKNEYGRAKLAGEQAIQASGVPYYIVRTSWVFGEFGHNFVYTMQKLGQKFERITVVSDQKGRPTWTRTLAEFMLHLIQVQADQGIYNLSNDGVATWFDFAQEILRHEQVEVVPVSSAEYPTKAYRPANSVLSLAKAKATGFKIPTWQEALHQFEKDI